MRRAPADAVDRSLSVVVPTLNEAAGIGRLVTGLHDLLASDDELLVIDGGSADGTPQLVAGLALPRLRLETAATAGRAAQMNAGARAARGAWLLFLHADTEPEPGALTAVRVAAQDPTVDWGYFRVRLDRPGSAYRWIERGINARSRLWDTPSGDQAIFVRRRAFDAVGGYPDVPFLEDLALGDALRRRAGRPHRSRVHVRTSARRWRRDGVCATVLRMWALRAAYRLGASPERLAQYYDRSNSPQAPAPASAGCS